MSNTVPEEWDIKTVDEVATVFAGGTPSRSNPDYYEGTIPWVKSGEVNTRLIYETEETISELAVKESSARWAKRGSVLVAMYGATAGKAARLMIDATLNQAVSAINGRENAADNWFLLYAIENNARELLNTVQGSGQPNLSGQLIKNLNLPIPPLPEQQKIADILSSVDDVIEKTRAQIDKLKDLKTGMMEELLTKGIGHTEFKDSPVGRIPSSWEVVSLGDTGRWKGGGTPSKSNKDYWNGTIPWVSPKDMKSEFIYQTEDQISEEAVSESSTNIVESGSILIVVRSGILKHTLPVAMAARDLTLNQDMKALTVTKRFSAQYVYQYLLANNHRVLRATLKAGNTVESLDFGEFSKFLIPCPPTEEQHKIANAVESIARGIRTKSSRLNTYINLKKALMRELLTGKVRVKIDQKESAVA